MLTMEQLPYPRLQRNRHRRDINSVFQKYVLPEHLLVEQWRVPAGTTVILYQSLDFGWCIVPEGTLDVRGFTMPRRIFKF